MRVIRPIEPRDLEPLIALVGSAGVGLTTLPPDREELAKRIQVSQASFDSLAPAADALYTFALEDLDTGRLLGVSAVAAAVGLRQPWYSYRVGLAVHASQELGIFTQTPTLFLSNDHTGQSELCSLFLDPAFRKDGNGSLLSKSRLLYIAGHRERFARKLIAELRGVVDDQGRSPFWESLGRHFFSMDFSHADYLTGAGHKSFVAELMPRHPLYSSFLTPDAQAAIGQTHAATMPARKLLEEEGLRYEGHVDIFDAGPVVECDMGQVGAISASRLRRISSDENRGQTPVLVSNTGGANFRAVLARGAPTGDSIALSAPELAALGVGRDDEVRVVALAARDRHA